MTRIGFIGQKDSTNNTNLSILSIWMGYFHKTSMEGVTNDLGDRGLWSIKAMCLV